MNPGGHGYSYFRLITKIIPGIAGGNAQTDFTFDDQPDLRYARLQSLVYYTDAEMLFAQPAAVPVLSGSLMNKVSFVFETNDPDDFKVQNPGPGMPTKSKGDSGRFSGTLDTIQWLPAADLHIGQSGAAPTSFRRQPIHWKDRYLVWQKSHLKIAPGGLMNTTDVAICLGAFYTFIDENGKVITPRN